jgi:ferrous iron transport protein B
MSGSKPPKIALIGNPNSGKSTIFNQLTGLNQHTGNFAGVTVEKKSGTIELAPGKLAEIIDLPGTYSIYPKSYDERIVFDILMDPQSEDYPEIVIVVTDASNLRRNLLLFTQLYDLGLPIILVLNMIDVAERQGIQIDTDALSSIFGNIPVIKTNSRKGLGLPELKKQINTLLTVKNDPHFKYKPFYGIEVQTNNILDKIAKETNSNNGYCALLIAHNYKNISSITQEQKHIVESIIKESGFDNIKAQTNETISRYKKLTEVEIVAIKKNSLLNRQKWVSLADRIITHKVAGYLILIGIFMLVFQSIFSWASYPMDLIDNGVTLVNEFLKNILPAGIFTDMITDGLIAGIGGVIIFIPQIAFLFAFISILEESGYMARVMFLMDNLMKPFGLNGKSIVPLFSGAACAIPAIMSARNISNSKERLITTFVTPLISCSARIPVYTIIIALVIPPTKVFGFINQQGLTMMLMYLLGFVMALLSALLLKFIVKTEERSFFILEMPDYKMPKPKNVAITVWTKVKSFVFEAGKVIIAISILLWFLATFGPTKAIENAERETIASYQKEGLTGQAELDNRIASAKLEASYAGHFGKFIEPAISPIGFDWKIGIAIITSFAAREVFVGTISTIYRVGSSDDESTLKEKLAQQKDTVTGKPFFNLARGISLLVFYAFALQCMSTIAIVKKETGKWRIAILQFLYLSVLAYAASFLAYSVLK